MQLAGSADYINGDVSGTSLYGLSPANQSKAAGASTPPVTAAGGDRQQVPWSPDSPMFWFAAIAGLTVLGMAAADVRVRLFKTSAEVRTGKT